MCQAPTEETYTEETYIDISFLYTEVITHKIIDIYTHKTADSTCLLAIIMVMNNQHYKDFINSIISQKLSHNKGNKKINLANKG